MDQSVTLPSDDARAAELARMNRLQAFADSLVKKRDEAVSFKKQTGVEEEWDEDEDYYNAIDPFAVKADKPTKGRSTTDRMKGGDRQDTGSDIFDNITAYHVDMRAARATDMLTPADDKPFKISPTPEPEISKAKDDPAAQTQMVTNAAGQQTSLANAITLMLQEATESAERAETWIWDKFIEFNWHAEFRKCIHEAHKIGCWVMKGPYPVRKRFKTISRVNGGIEITEGESIEPASRAIDPRNLFPDASCYPSENIQKGSHIWEKDEVSYKQLEEMKGMTIQDADGNPVPMYLDRQIDDCLAEGPNPDRDKPAATTYKPNPKDLYTIWYGYVTATKEDMEAAGCECDDMASVPAQVTIVNDRVIQATLSPLDAGEFPYDILVLDRRPGTPWGKGISRKVRVPQRQVNGLERAWMKNAGLCSGPIIITRAGKLVALDGGSVSVRPFAMLGTTDEAEKVSDSLHVIQIESRQQELLQGIQFALNRADQLVGNAPQDQGQQNDNPETAKGRLILQNNSNAPQRQIARNADDGVIEPHVKRYYNYWLKHADGDKGSADHQIEALGSTAMFERDAEQQFLLQVWGSGLATNPDSRIDVNKLTEELLKGNKINPTRIRFNDDEWKARQEQMAQNPPKPESVQVAEVRAQSAEKIAEGNQKVTVEKMKMDTDRDTIYAQAEAARSAENHDYNVQKLELDKSIALLKEHGADARTIDTLKAKLAQVTMELKMQEKLALGKQAAEGTPQVAPDAVEPVGQAPDGQAFQK